MISQMFEKKLKRDVFRLSVISLITVLIWIGVTTFNALNKDQVKPEVKKQILPLTPSVDAETMNDIRQRLVVPEADWGSLSEKLPVIVVQNYASESGELVLPDFEASTSADFESSASAEM